MKTTIRKVFPSLPFAHRQPNHKGHCALIHGHNWTFALTLACDKFDACGFVMDFGKFKTIREWLDSKFDHTLVLNSSDPLLDMLQEALTDIPYDPTKPDTFDLAKIVEVPDCGCEGLARYVFEELNKVVPHFVGNEGRGVRVAKVELYEDEKNSATVEE